MSTGDDGTKDIQGDGEAVLRDAEARLRELLAELAHNLRPFPAFLNMASVQAVELESPPSRPRRTMAAWWCFPRAKSARWTCR